MTTILERFCALYSNTPMEMIHKLEEVMPKGDVIEINITPAVEELAKATAEQASPTFLYSGGKQVAAFFNIKQLENLNSFMYSFLNYSKQQLFLKPKIEDSLLKLKSKLITIGGLVGTARILMMVGVCGVAWAAMHLPKLFSNDPNEPVLPMWKTVAVIFAGLGAIMSLFFANLILSNIGRGAANVARQLA